MRATRVVPSVEIVSSLLVVTGFYELMTRQLVYVNDNGRVLDCGHEICFGTFWLDSSPS